MAPIKNSKEELVECHPKGGTEVVRMTRKQFEALLQFFRNELKKQIWCNISTPSKKGFGLSAMNSGECSICREPMSGGSNDHFPFQISCGHAFGFSCLDTWLNAQTKPSCPMCRAKLSKTVEERKAWEVVRKEFQKSSNRWDEQELRRQLAAGICTKEWVRELTEIWASLVLPLNVDKGYYREKAKTFVRGIEEQLFLEAGGSKNKVFVYRQLGEMNIEADRLEALAVQGLSPSEQLHTIDTPLIDRLFKLVEEYLE